MSINEITQKLNLLKPQLKKEGISLIGIFGSYARGDYNSSSDVDILYKIDNVKEFYFKNRGFNSFTKLTELKEFIEKELNKSIDFVDINSLNSIGKDFIIKEVKNV